MVPPFLQESILPKKGIQKNSRPVPIKITNQVVSKVNHFSKITDTKKAQYHLQKHFLIVAEEMGDMILSHFPVTLMIIMTFSLITDIGKVIVAGDVILPNFLVTLMIIVAFSQITDTGKVIVVLDFIIGMQYKMSVCRIMVPVEAHINTEVKTMLEASISNAVVRVIPTVGSSTTVVHSRRRVDKAKEGVCNFIEIPNIPLPSPQGLTACPMFHRAFSLLSLPSFIMAKLFMYDILWTISIVSHFSKHSI
jgi:hypothetical protein